MICGYALDTRFLLDYGFKHGVSRPNVRSDEFDAVVHILHRVGLFRRAQIRGAYVLEDGKEVSKLCLALANNFSEKGLKLPSEKRIKKLQEVLRTDERPRWYHRV